MNRKTILKNSLWGNFNVIARYGASFIAVALIARSFGAEDFGRYQFALSVVPLLDSFYPLSPQHLRNYLISHPEDEGAVIFSWKKLFTLYVFLLFSSMAIGALLFPRLRNIIFLIFLCSLHIPFMIFEYPQVLLDTNNRSDLVQQNQIASFGVLNFFRIVFTLLFKNLYIVASTTLLQGLAFTASQFFHMKKLTVAKAGIRKPGLTRMLFKAGLPLSVAYLLNIAQGRILSIFLPLKMELHEYGNYQLLIKLIDPVITIGSIILSANFVILSKTYEEKKDDFFIRFRKVAALTLGLSTLSSLAFLLIPKDLFILIFKQEYEMAYEYLFFGVAIVLVQSLFSISIQKNILMKDYKKPLFKYSAIIILSSSVLLIGKLSIKNALFMQIIIPFLINTIFTAKTIFSKL